MVAADLFRQRGSGGRGRPSREWCEFPKALCGEIHCRITERLRELSAYIDHDVGRKLRVTFDIFRVEVGHQFCAD